MEAFKKQIWSSGEERKFLVHETWKDVPNIDGGQKDNTQPRRRDKISLADGMDSDM